MRFNLISFFLFSGLIASCGSKSGGGSSGDLPPVNYTYTTYTLVTEKNQNYKLDEELISGGYTSYAKCDYIYWPLVTNSLSMTREASSSAADEIEENVDFDLSFEMEGATVTFEEGKFVKFCNNSDDESLVRKTLFFTVDAKDTPAGEEKRFEGRELNGSSRFTDSEERSDLSVQIDGHDFKKALAVVNILNASRMTTFSYYFDDNISTTVSLDNVEPIAQGMYVADVKLPPGKNINSTNLNFDFAELKYGSGAVTNPDGSPNVGIKIQPYFSTFMQSYTQDCDKRVDFDKSYEKTPSGQFDYFKMDMMTYSTKSEKSCTNDRAGDYSLSPIIGKLPGDTIFTGRFTIVPHATFSNYPADNYVLSFKMGAMTFPYFSDLDNSSGYPNIDDYAVYQNYIYALSENSSVARSLDSGSTWSSLGVANINCHNFTYGCRLGAVRGYPTIFGVYGNSVSVQFRNNTSWVSSQFNLDANSASMRASRSHVSDTGKYYVLGSYLSGNQGYKMYRISETGSTGVFTSTDMGSLPADVGVVKAMKADYDAYVMVLNSSGTLYFTKDAGVTWSSYSFGTMDSTYPADVQLLGDKMYVVMNGKLFYSTDGATWMEKTIQKANTESHAVTVMQFVDGEMYVLFEPIAKILNPNARSDEKNVLFKSDDSTLSTFSVNSDLVLDIKNRIFSNEGYVYGRINNIFGFDSK